MEKTNPEAWRIYIGKALSWKTLIDMGVIEAKPMARIEQRQCDIDGCGRPHYAKGKCLRHYQRTRQRRSAGILECQGAAGCNTVPHWKLETGIIVCVS